MDSTSSEAAPNEPVAVNDDEETPMDVIKTDESDIVKMTIDGLDVENEETMIMTVEEVQNYIQTKVAEYMRDPNFNPLLVLRNQVSVLQEKIKQKNEEIMKLNRVFEVLYKDQVKFLRHIGILPKVETKTVGVFVDLAWLPDAVPGLLCEDAFKAKTLSENLSKQNKVNNPSSTLSAKPQPKKKDSTGPIECIDLTDDNETPDVPVCSASANKNVVTSAPTTSNRIATSTVTSLQHPAPLPALTVSSKLSEIPPKPRLKLSADNKGIVLQWDLPPPTTNMTITGFEIYGYQEKGNIPITSSLWKKIGTVKPMALPMSCTLTQFMEKHRYHFSVRAITTASGEERYGFFSEAASIMFLPDKPKTG